MSRANRHAPEVRERAVRMVFEHENEYSSQWAAVSSIASKIGCSPETLCSWFRIAETDAGRREGFTSSEREQLKALEKENRELKRANEILKTASAFFVQAEFDSATAPALLYFGPSLDFRRLK